MLKTISTVSVEGLASRLDDLKAKEKNLASKGIRLRELQKKLNVKEINLGDTVDRVEYSKVFISQLENKIKELQSSNRLLRLKVLSSPEPM